MSEFAKSFSQSKTFAFFILLVATLYIYLPSVRNPPKADQWGFLLENYNSGSCLSEIGHTYSYNRTTIVAPGDRALFRPVLFFYLSLVDCVGRTNLKFVQSLGLILHFFVLCVIFLTLDTVLKSLNLERDRSASMATVFSLTFTLLVASTPNLIEQVIWAHIHGYLLSTLLVLIGILMSLRNDNGSLTETKKYVILFLICLGASFCYEGNQFLPVWICGVILLSGGLAHRRLGMAASFLLIPVLYVAVSLYDGQIHEVSPGTLLRESGGHATLSVTAFNYIRFFRYTLWDPFFSIVGNPDYNGRLLIHEKKFTIPFAVATSALLTVLLGVLIGSIRSSIRWWLGREQKSGLSPKLIVLITPLALWLGSYSTMNVLGRMNAHPGPAVLDTNTYYTYIPTLITVLWLAPVLYGLFALGWGPLKRKFDYRIMIPLIVFLNFYSVVRAQKAREMNKFVAQAERPTSDLLRAIAKRINQDPFAKFRLAKKENFTYFHGIAEPQIFLGASKFDACAAVYNIISHPPYLTERGEDTDCDPIFVKPGPTWNFYWHRGEYIATLRWEGPFDPARSDYTVPIRAKTWEQLLARIPEMQLKLDKLIADGTYRLPPSSFQP